MHIEYLVFLLRAAFLIVVWKFAYCVVKPETQFRRILRIGIVLMLFSGYIWLRGRG
jgi:hypothetical protein